MIVEGSGFAASATPTVSAGAYSQHDVIGGLLEFKNIAPRAGASVIIQRVQVILLADVDPDLDLILFSEAPTGINDNAALSISDADAFKIVAGINSDSAAATYIDIGNSRLIEFDNLAKAVTLKSDSTSLHGFLVDRTGVTLTSTADVKVVIHGVLV